MVTSQIPGVVNGKARSRMGSDTSPALRTERNGALLRRWIRRSGAALMAIGCTLASAGCATTAASPPEQSSASALPGWLSPEVGADPFPSTYKPAPSGDVAIINATILTANGPQIPDGRVIISDNKIAAVGADAAIPDGARIIDAKGKWVTPGIIDPHSHIATDGVNEITTPNTAQMKIEASVLSGSPDIPRMVAATGITTFHLLPGSGNEFAGRTVVLKALNAPTVQEIKFPGAPAGMKIACGENPTRVYGAQGRSPMTRAQLIADLRAALYTGGEYARKWDAYREKVANGQAAEPPRRDFQAEAVGDVVEGRALAHVHCYRSEDMAFVMDVAKEFDFKINAFHHAIEAYQIIPLLKERGTCAVIWGSPDWGEFKMEAYNNTALSAGMLERAGACVALHTDAVITAGYLNVDAGRAMLAANRAGLDIKPEEAIRWITLNAAKVLGIDQQTGSLEPGKMADVVVWSGNPFSNLSYPDQVLIDGVEVYRHGVSEYERPTVLEIGMPGRRYEP